LNRERWNTRLLNKMKVLIAGGDTRYIPVMEQLAKQGASVSVAGYDQIKMDQTEIVQTKIEKVDFGQLDAVLLPVSGTDPNGHVTAMYADSPVVLSQAFFSKTPEHCVIYTGISGPYLEDIAKQTNRKIVRLFERDDVAIFNSVPTAEGTLKLAIEETDQTIHSSDVLVLGFGRVGSTVSRTFQAIGANVTVGCRKPADYARIHEMSMKPVHMKNLDEVIGEQQIIINTIPHHVLDEERLAKVNRSALIIDLTSKPGGTNFKAAEQLGIKTIHALGIPGKTAPQTAGEIIAQVMIELLQEQNLNGHI